MSAVATRRPKTEDRGPKAKVPEARKPEARGLLGAHISTAGGVANAPPRADEIGATAMQIFTKQPNRWAAGYDLINDYDGVWAQFDGVIGIDSLGLIHLNDSKAPLGSKKDRHELIGAGEIGTRPFARMMRDERLAKIPKVLETPKGDDLVTNDRRMLKTLRVFAATK